MSRVSRAALAGLLALAALPVILAVPSSSVSAGPAPVFTMFVPFEEEDISEGLFSILTAIASTDAPVTTQITLTAAADNTIIYWDHHEDGYDADIANAPVTSTTETWGDGDRSDRKRSCRERVSLAV